MSAFVALATLAFALQPLHAWSPGARTRMVRDASKLVPYALRAQLERHERELLRGMLEPLSDEGGLDHRPGGDGGRLLETADARAAAAVAAVDARAPFSEVARRFGELAHFIADAGYPPNAGGTDDDRRYRHFGAFVDDRLPKFRFVFYGHLKGEPGPVRASRIAAEALARAADQDVDLARAYARAGDPPHPSAFDDRSIPFAIGSLAYSRTVTAIVHAWMETWRAARGDMTRTPLWNAAPHDVPRDPGGKR